MRGNRKFLLKDFVHPSNKLVKRLQRGESPFRLSENLACVTRKDKKKTKNFVQPKVIKMWYFWRLSLRIRQK